MMKVAEAPSVATDLYDTDLYLWSEQQAAVLRDRRWPETDVV